MTSQPSNHSAGVAAVLSFVVPGLGQIYNGELSEGIAGLVLCLLGYALIVPGLFIHFLLIRDAYRTALHGRVSNDRLPWYKKRYYLPGDHHGD